METYKKLLYWLLTTCIAAVISVVQMGVDPRTDKTVMAWICTLAIAGVIYAVAQLYATMRERERLTAKHDELIDSAMKVLLRQKLVSEHDRLMDLGAANDTQRRSWQASYETYEALCDVTGDSNGVIDVYRANVMALPSDVPSDKGGDK